MTEESERITSVLWDADWEEILTAADSAGRHAAREFARQCSAWHLGRTGRVYVHIAPGDSPLSAWMRLCGYATLTEDNTARIEVTLNTVELATAAAPRIKTRSVLVRRAYAAAYCTVLTEETGAITREEIVPDRRIPQQRSLSSTVEQPERAHQPATGPQPTYN